MNSALNGEFKHARLAFNELGNCLRDGGFSIETIADIVHPLLLVAPELEFLDAPRTRWDAWMPFWRGFAPSATRSGCLNWVKR